MHMFWDGRLWPFWINGCNVFRSLTTIIINRYKMLHGKINIFRMYRLPSQSSKAPLDQDHNNYGFHFWNNTHGYPKP